MTDDLNYNRVVCTCAVRITCRPDLNDDLTCKGSIHLCFRVHCIVFFSHNLGVHVALQKIYTEEHDDFFRPKFCLSMALHILCKNYLKIVTLLVLYRNGFSGSVKKSWTLARIFYIYLWQPFFEKHYHFCHDWRIIISAQQFFNANCNLGSICH